MCVGAGAARAAFVSIDIIRVLSISVNDIWGASPTSSYATSCVAGQAVGTSAR